MLPCICEFRTSTPGRPVAGKIARLYVAPFSGLWLTGVIPGRSVRVEQVEYPAEDDQGSYMLTISPDVEGGKTNEEWLAGLGEGWAWLNIGEVVDAQTAI
jgi:hypothetical protein